MKKSYGWKDLTRDRMRSARFNMSGNTESEVSRSLWVNIPSFHVAHIRKLTNQSVK